jgi:hypothetical protein
MLLLSDNLVRAEVGLDQEGQGGLDAKAGVDQRLDPEAMKVVGVLFNLGEQVVESFELPAALEIFAVQALAKLLDESVGSSVIRFFAVRFVAHLFVLSIIRFVC